MRSVSLVLTCCCLIGCSSCSQKTSDDPDASAKPPATFQEQQKYLFYEIDHKLVYQGCQELMRRHREGNLSASTYFCDDPDVRLNELPEPLRALRPTFVRVDEIMLQMAFRSDDGTQYLQCLSNEFGEPVPSDEGTKGLGFRINPYAMDRLSGTESLDYLNANYKHFEVSLVPGLTYQVVADEPSPTLTEMKRSSQESDTMVATMQETMNELAVKQQRLLYNTNHQELLQACREAIKRFQEGAFSTHKVNIMPEEVLQEVTHIDRDMYARDLQQIPKIILDLEPVYLWFEENRVMVALIGGFDHAGVFAYMNDTEAVARDDDMKLIDGLRYYDDGLREGGEEYKEYLKSLEHEAITPTDWRRKQMNLPLPSRK